MSLGKGLGALITSTSKRKNRGKINKDDKQVWDIPLGSVYPDPDQPRKHFDVKELENLAQSIREHGILQPILVTEKADGGYEIISGERRWRAAKIAGLVDVPCLVKKFEEQKKVEVSLIENIQREDLNPIEEAFAYKRLIDEFGMKQSEIGAKVGKARPTIGNMIRLLELPEQAKNALIEGKIGQAQARSILAFDSIEKQLEILSALLEGKIKSAEDVARKASRKNLDTGGVNFRRDPNMVYLEDQLREKLGTKVTITQRGSKGKITIEYYSKEDLSHIINRLNQ